MAVRTSVTTDAAGRRVVAKVAGDAEDGARLQREAAQLHAGRHPGVVELVGTDGHGPGSMLLTAHVEGPTLAQLGPLPLEEAAGLLAALANTLADLHDLGLVHGAVAPDHVVVDPGGRPVLCGLASGGRAGERPGPAPTLSAGFTDPARADAEVLSPAFDVYGVGALARFLAPQPPAGHVLGKVADEATSEDPASRPSARAVAHELAHEVPAARLPRGLVSPPPGQPGFVSAGVPQRYLSGQRADVSAAPADPLAAWRRARGGLGAGSRAGWARAATVMAAVGVIGVGGAAVLAWSASRPVPPAEVSSELPVPLPPDEAQPGPTTTRAGLAPSPTTTVAARGHDCAPATAVLQADVDGDGCPEPLRYADGILQAGDVRWSLGQAGDQVATGDWACQGSRTLALFRPSTGQLFRFGGWAGPGHDLTAIAVARVEGGQALRAADVDRDGCHEAVIERGMGPAEVVRLPRAGP